MFPALPRVLTQNEYLIANCSCRPGVMVSIARPKLARAQPTDGHAEIGAVDQVENVRAENQTGCAASLENEIEDWKQEILRQFHLV